MKRSRFILSLLAAGAVAAMTVAYAMMPDGASSGYLPGSAGSGGMDTDNAMWGNTPSIMAVLDTHSQFSDFRRAVERAGLSSTLETKGPFTVFVPTDEAFNRLPSPAEEKILANPQEAKAVVLNQMASGDLVYGATGTKMDLARVGFIVTADGNRIPVIVSHHKVKIGQARLVEANIPASNGIIHVVDQVSFSPSAK